MGRLQVRARARQGECVGEARQASEEGQPASSPPGCPPCWLPCRPLPAHIHRQDRPCGRVHRRIGHQDVEPAIRVDCELDEALQAA